MLQGPAAAANKLAMSKALGAAFLNHQVEQLEKSVNGNRQDNWRDRRYRGPPPERTGNNNRKALNTGGQPNAAQRVPRPKSGVADRVDYTNVEDREKPKRQDGQEKDADVVVVDASVLIHALPQVKKWCRDGRQEIVIVPLEGATSHPSAAYHRFNSMQPLTPWIS
jgi:hypothetical protein